MYKYGVIEHLKKKNTRKTPGRIRLNYISEKKILPLCEKSFYSLTYTYIIIINIKCAVSKNGEENKSTVNVQISSRPFHYQIERTLDS